MTGGAPARRLLAGWTVLVWTAWLFSRELLECRHLPAMILHWVTPPWPAAAQAAGTAARGLAGAALVLLACHAAGDRLLRWLTPRTRPRPAAAAPGRPAEGSGAASLAAGFALVALAVQGAGVAALLRPALLLPALAAAALAGIPAAVRTWRRRNGVRPDDPRQANLPAAPRLAMLAASAASVVMLVAACAPEVAWDAMVYHLRVPSLYLLRGGIHPVPEIFPSYFPFTGETLFVLARAAGGDPAARLLHAAAWIAAGFAVGGLAVRLHGAPAAGWARAAFLTIPFGMAIGSRAYVDGFLVLPLVAGLEAVMAPGGALRAGWLGGAAFGAKYLGGAGAVVIFAMTLARRGRRAALLTAVAGIAAGSWWLTRNWLWTGNPVYPVIFGGPRWTPADMAGWADDARSFRLDGPGFLAAPWTLMREPGSDGPLSPLLIAAPAAAFLFGAGRARSAWVAAAVLFAVWWITAPLPRYLAAAAAVSAAAGAAALAGAGQGPAARRLWTRLMILGTWGGLACGVRAIAFGTSSFEPALGKVSAEAYREAWFRPAGYGKALEMTARQVAPGRRPYVLGHIFAYDLPRAAWFEFLYVRPPLHWWLRDCADGRDAARKARQAGLTHLLYHPVGARAILGGKPWLSDWTPRRLAVWREFVTTRVRETARLDDWILYEIGNEQSGRPLSRPRHAARGATGPWIPGTEGAAGMVPGRTGR